MHKSIKKYTHCGEIRDDSDFIRLRQELESMMIEEMRELGYLPVYELSSHWSTKRLEKKYSFVLTVYFSYAGRAKARQYDFWQNGRLIKSG